MDVRIIYSLQSAFIFFIIASPYMYSLTSKIIKLSPYGQVALHSLIYGLIVYGLWLLVVALRK